MYSDVNNQQMMSMFPHLSNFNENCPSNSQEKDFKEYTVLKPTGIDELVL